MGFRIPESLHEVTIGQYQKYLAAIEGLEENNEAVIEIATVIFCNISLKDLRSLSRKEVDIISMGVVRVLNAFADEQELVRRFWLNGKEYGFIPNIDEKISYGENKDVVRYINEGKDSLHKYMAVLYRPIVKSSETTYSIEEYKHPVEHEKAFKDAPVSILLGANVFFYNLTKELLMHIPNYLNKEMGEKVVKELIQRVSTNPIGENMTKYSASLKETLEDLMK